jgi:hypothetical protein
MTATLEVCKTVGSDPRFLIEFEVQGNNPSPDSFQLRAGECQDVTMGPGDYLVREIFPTQGPSVFITGDCYWDMGDFPEATGNIQAGETQNCDFTNTGM